MQFALGLLVSSVSVGALLVVLGSLFLRLQRAQVEKSGNMCQGLLPTWIIFDGFLSGIRVKWTDATARWGLLYHVQDVLRQSHVKDTSMT